MVPLPVLEVITSSYLFINLHAITETQEEYSQFCVINLFAVIKYIKPGCAHFAVIITHFCELSQIILIYCLGVIINLLNAILVVF